MGTLNRPCRKGPLHSILEMQQPELFMDAGSLGRRYLAVVVVVVVEIAVVVVQRKEN